MSYDIVRAAWGTSPWQVEDESQVVDLYSSRSRVREEVTSPVYTQDWTSHCFESADSDDETGDISAVNTALNIDLILLKIFSYTDFQTLKNCRVVQKSWRNCADFEIRQRNCSRTFVTPENVLELLGDLQKPGDLVTSVPSSELVLEKTDGDDSSSYWPNLYKLFFTLCPPESDHRSQVKSLTFIWPTCPKDDGLSKNVIHYFLQILQLVSSSLQELNVTHYLMAYIIDLDDNDLQPDLTFDLPNLKSIKILPRAPSDIHYDHKPLALSSRSLGLWLIQLCPNLEKVDDLHLDDPLKWPDYFHLVKNYVIHQRDTADDLDTFSEAELALENLSDSFYVFPYALENQVKMREDNDDDDDLLDMINQWHQVLWTSRNTLKKLQLAGNLPFNFPSPNFPILQNLQELQVKVGGQQNLDDFFNLVEDDFCDENPLPNLKKVVLILESGWKNCGAVNFDTTVAYGSVTSLELCPEFANQTESQYCPFEFPPIWFEALAKFFPNVENLTLTNAVKLHRALPSFLGPGSKFKNLRAIRFNVHLSAWSKYPLLGPVLRALTATPENRQSVQGLRKLDIIFEDYFYKAGGGMDVSRISVEALKLFLNVLPDLQLTFHYNHSHFPQELLSWLRPLADHSPKVGFRHLSREPWARAVDAAFYNPEVESWVTFLGPCILGLFIALIFVTCLIEKGCKYFPFYKDVIISSDFCQLFNSSTGI